MPLKILLSVWRRFLKWLAHRCTGKCEIHRLCESGWHNGNMSFSVIVSVYKSEVLIDDLRSFFQKIEVFDTKDILQLVIAKKNISNNQKIVIENLGHCFHSLRAVHVVMKKFISLHEDPFNSSNPEHIASLNKFWDVMKPNIRREGGMVTSEWGELGFQGSNPSTDFRGMGILGLTQLVYFAEYHNGNAKTILLESNHSRRYYPFAATGINMTSFILDLLKGKRLYRYLLTQLEIGRSKVSSNFTETPSENEHILSLLMDALHELYCLLFSQFHQLWVLRDPPNIMSFQEIFSDIKKDFFLKYPKIDDYY